MSDPVNLNRVRKKKAHTARQKRATDNRVAFGRSGAEKKAARDHAERAKTLLDGKKIDRKSDN